MDGGSDKAVTERQAGCYTTAGVHSDATDVAATYNPDGTLLTPARKTCAAGSTYSEKRDAASASENIDEWAIAAKYGVRGFTVAGVYQTQPSGSRVLTSRTVAGGNTGSDVYKDEDNTFWALRGGYSQDNWAVNAWYGQHNTSDTVSPMLGDNNITGGTGDDADTQPDDSTVFSVAGNIDVGKVGLVVIHENLENEWGKTNTATVFNVDYRFTSKSRVWGAYVAKDYDTDTDKDDEIHIGLRMDF